MRKYQQLLLLVFSCISLIVLFIYKSENNRLKYVLQVVNFFGRKDASMLLQFENMTNDNINFAHPMPVWQALDDSFHAYAAFWLNNNENLALAEVVGKRNANVRFSCQLNYDDGTHVEGKFRFQHTTPETTNIDFIIYTFLCQIPENIKEKPESVIFKHKDLASAAALKLRLLTSWTTTTTAASTVNAAPILCLDLMSDLHNLNHFTKNIKYMLQFFLHYKILGIEQFIVYQADALPSRVVRMLRQAPVQLHLLPFNFPFAIKNDTAPYLRKIILTDCLRRSAPATQNVLLVAANEFFYAKSKLDGETSVLHNIQKYDSPVAELRVTKIDICLNTQQPLLIDNTAYDSSRPNAPNDALIYHLPGINLIGNNLMDTTTKSVPLPISLAFVHNYVECTHISKDGLSDFRNTLREEFAHFQRLEHNELSMLIK